MGVGYWGFTGHARHKSVASLRVSVCICVLFVFVFVFGGWIMDIGGLLVTHGTNQLQVSHILTGRSYICLTVMVSWKEDKDEKIT